VLTRRFLILERFSESQSFCFATLCAHFAVNFYRRVRTKLLSTPYAPALLGRFLSRFFVGVGKLDIDRHNFTCVTIGKAAQEGAEELPFAPRFARADDFAIDHAIMNGPVHPTGIG